MGGVAGMWDVGRDLGRVGCEGVVGGGMAGGLPGAWVLLVPVRVQALPLAGCTMIYLRAQRRRATCPHRRRRTMVDEGLHLLLAQQRRAGHPVVLGSAQNPGQIGLLRAHAQTFELNSADEGGHLFRPRLR